MSRPRWVLIGAAVLAGGLLVLSVLSGLAVNAASDLPWWPGPLDLIRRYPWWTVLGLGVLTVLLGVPAALIGRSGPDSASKDDLLGSEQRLRQHFDAVGAARHDVEDRISRLPPYPCALLLAAGGDRAHIWTMVAQFADEAVVPEDLAREWAASLPVALDDLPVMGRLVVAELLLAYRQPTAAAEQFQTAVKWGAAPRPYWLVRIALIHGALDQESSAGVDKILAEAEQIDAAYPLVKAMKSDRANEWDQMRLALEGWEPSTPWESDTARSFRCVALVRLGRLDEAIAVMEGGAGETRHAGNLLQLAKLLQARAVQGTGDSRFADAARAVEIGIRARNLRRVWRGDSAEAVALAAEAAVIAEDPAQVWALTRLPPDGQATVAEAADLRVLPVAALGAALTGRFMQARELVDAAPDGYVRRRIEAEIASASLVHGEGPSAVEAWQAALEAAPTDDDKLRALRGLALEGATDRTALEALRARHPEAAAEIENMATIESMSGPDADERLRALEARSPMASVRRAELLRHDDPEAAAEILIDATAQWREPRLLLLAVDCYQDAGRWEQADRVAQEALAQHGPLWPGRATVLRRIVDIQSARNDWPKVESACRALLEIDPNDEDARWSLVYAHYRGGDPQQAWQTLNRAAAPSNPSTPMRARLLLDLARRYAGSVEVAHAAMAMLRAYPDDHDMHAAVISTVTMRTDRTELPEDIGSQVTAAWQSFFERYPDSEHFTAYTVRDDDNPLVDIEPQMRQQATTYHELRDQIRDENYPIGMLDLVVGKPYSAIFPYRPLGYHRMAFAGDQDIAFELDLARYALAGSCLIDASALYTLALLPDVAPTLLALIPRPAITDVALRDLVETDDLFGTPSSGTLEYDTRLERVVTTEDDPDITRRQRAQIQAMLTTARSLRRITHPELIHLPSPRPHREQVWALTLDAAKHNDIPLWADDTGLRIVAHSMGIKTFGTQSLLTIARERQRIDTPTLNQITRELIREYIVDLPYDHHALLDIAAEQSWKPRSIAMILNRAATWANGRPALELFRTVFRNSPDTELKAWAYAALTGVRDMMVPDQRHKKLTVFTVIMLSDGRVRPAHGAAFIAALNALIPDEAGAIVQAALKEIWTRLKEAYPSDRAVTVFLHIISQLDDAHRQYGTQLILE